MGLPSIKGFLKNSHNSIVDHFHRPTPRRRKLSVIFGGLTWPPKISLFLVAPDTAAENRLLFSAAKPEPPKIRLFKNRRSLLLCSFSPLPKPVAAARVSHARPPACLRAPPARVAARPACCPAAPLLTARRAVRHSEPPPIHRHRRATASRGNFLRILFLIFGSCYLGAAEMSVYL
jgi:hypothetical protein